MSKNPIGWKVQYVVARTRGATTAYFYGQKRKEAIERARLKPGDGFAYAKFERGAVQWAEIGATGTTVVEHGPLRRRAA